MECLGGNGYVEESILPRLYREAPVNAIWEGSGNVMCLDVLRAFSREREAGEALLAGLVEETAGLPGAAEASASIVETLLKQPDADRVARPAVETLALLAAAAALNAVHSNNAEQFAAARLNFNRGRLYGAVDINQHESGRLLERALS